MILPHSQPTPQKKKFNHKKGFPLRNVHFQLTCSLAFPSLSFLQTCPVTGEFFSRLNKASD